MTANPATAQDEVVDICRDLLRIDTSNPGDHSGPGERTAAEHVAALLAEAPDGLEIYSGNDADTLPLLSIGAVGTISVESHWAGEQVSEMIAAEMIEGMLR